MRFISLPAVCFCLFTFASAAALAETGAADIKVGATLALSGKFAFVGTAQLRGLEMAADEINRSGGIGGRKLVIVPEDNAGDPKQAITGVSKLSDADHVDIFFAGLSHIVEAVKTPIKSRKKLFIYGGGVAGATQESPLFFRDWGDAPSTGALIAESMRLKGYKRVAYLAESSDVCLEVRKGFAQAALAGGPEIIREESYSAGESDLRSIIVRILAAKPEALAACTFRDGGTLLTRMKELGSISLPVFHCIAPLLPVNDSPDVRKLYEENSSLSTWFGFIPDDPTEREARFEKDFVTQFGETPRMESMLTYDDAMIMASALKSCGGAADSDCLAKSIGNGTFEGVSGPITFDSERHANRKDFLMRVSNGRWHRVSGH